MDEWTDGQMDEQKERHINRQMDGWMDTDRSRQTDR